MPWSRQRSRPSAASIFSSTTPASTHKNQSLMTVTEDEFDRIYAVNVKSIYLTTLAIVPVMEKRGGGSIINTASTAGVRPRPGLTWYNGSKGAAITLTKSMAAELAPKNIRVNAINPVIGETGLLEQFMGVPDTPENRAKFIAGIPLGPHVEAASISPMPRSFSPIRRAPSSPASPSRSTADGASSLSVSLGRSSGAIYLSWMPRRNRRSRQSIGCLRQVRAWIPGLRRRRSWTRRPEETGARASTPVPYTSGD